LLRILNVVGARPNFMKIAPLIHAMRGQADIEPLHPVCAARAG